MMQTIKKVLFSPEYSVRDRFFNLAGVVGSIATFMVFVINILTGQSPVLVAAMAGSFLFFSWLTWMMIHSRKYKIIGPIAVLFSIVVVQPLGFFFGGGIFSGSPLWLLIYYVMCFLMFEGKLLWFFVAITTMEAGVVLYLSALHPEWVSPLEGQYAIYQDIFFSLVVLGILFGGLIKLQSRLMERETRLAEEQKAEIEKLNESQNRFFSAMSHEIRTPINTIIGLNEMTLREPNLPAEVLENATGVQNASRMLLALINDILDLSKIQSGKMEVAEGQYETTRMLSEIVNLLWNRAREKGLRFDINVGENIPSMLYGDEMRLKQVIVNLLTNAIKYTSEGHVLLNVNGTRTDTNRFLLRIDIEDTGIGIRKEAIPQLFETFKRLDDEQTKTIEGTGLGLSIAKQLVELMNGTITVDSIFTKGSTFHVEIPQRIVNDTPVDFKRISGTETEQKIYHQAFEAPEAKVLIVDDNEMNRVVTGKLLRGTLVKVDLAASGAECLRMTAEQRYDVIFMDHEMPDMDGLETLDRIRSQTNGLCRETPVVALTANAGSDRNTFYADRGFQGYLAKPIHSSLLEAILMQLLPSTLIEHRTEEAKADELYVGRALRKRNVIITTDCVCDLPEDVVAENNIRLMPFYCETKEGRFRDLTEIDADNLLQYMADNGGNVSTHPAEVSEYEAFFAAALTEAEQVIHLSIGGHFDAGYQRALQAAASFGNVQVIDTGLLSSSLGLSACYAAKLAREGKRAEEIMEELPGYMASLRSFFLVPYPGALRQKRKAVSFVSAMSKVFAVAPVFRLKNGQLKLIRFQTGHITDAAEQFVKKTLRKRKNIDWSIMYVTYSGCTIKEREDLLRFIMTYGAFEEVVLQKASATISANSGLHSFSLTYRKKDQ